MYNMANIMLHKLAPVSGIKNKTKREVNLNKEHNMVCTTYNIIRRYIGTECF